MSTSKSKYDPADFTKLYINGEYVSARSGKTYALKNPKNNEIVVNTIPIAGQEDVDIAVKGAEAAYEGEWSKFTALQRTECLHRLAAIMEEELIPILSLDSLTSGNPTSIIPTREKTYIKNCIVYFSGWTDKQKGDFFPADDGIPSFFHIAQGHVTDKATRLREGCYSRAARCMRCSEPIQRSSANLDPQGNPSFGNRECDHSQTFGKDTPG